MLEIANIIDALGWAIVHSFWQSAVVALVLAILLKATKGTSARLRYVLNCVALLVCFFLPLITFLSGLSLHVPTSTISSQTQVISVVQLNATSAYSLVDCLRPYLMQIVLVWFVVVSILVVRFFLGLWWLHSALKDRRNIGNQYWQQRIDNLAQVVGIANRVVLYVVKDLQSPITMGFIRPVILVPGALITKMDPRFLEALLAHEIAHIRRYDYLVNLIQNMIEIVLFYHPVIWWISKQIRQERENIADDIAVGLLHEPRSLALALQELEKFQFSITQPALGAHGGHLMSRIKRLVRPEQQAYSLKTVIACVIAAITSIGVVAHASNRDVIAPPMKKEEQSAAPEANKPVLIDLAIPEVITSRVVDKSTVISTTPATISNSTNDKDESERPVEETAVSLPKTEPATSEKADEVPAQAKTAYHFKAPKIDFSQPGCRPEFPLAARRIAPSGTTRLFAMVGEDGKVQKVDVVSSSGFDFLDQAVKEALLSPNCIGTPGTINGKPFATQVRADFNWVGTADKQAPYTPVFGDQSSFPATRPATVNFATTGCRPEYPLASRSNQETGLTELNVSIDTEGNLSDVRVLRSSGFRGLDKALVAALSKGTCKAQPSFVDGLAVNSVIEVSYLWKLN